MMRRVGTFSLTGLLLVAGLTLPACGKAGEDYSREVLHGLDQGKLTGTKGTMETFGRALSAYSVDHGGYPQGADIDAAAQALSPAYLRAPMLVDAWGNRLQYQSDGQSFTLSSPGSDGAAGTGDDVVLKDGQFTQLPSPGKS
ncbi:MAG TPA: type II secretion system protein GspG [Candidatus Polarisedimenticolia bacterium]|nr:type II secretion system protein GspG [Candidatus Polarisedimenticolia bacterium]